MQRLEVSDAVRPLYGSLGVKGLSNSNKEYTICYIVKDCVSHNYFIALATTCAHYLVQELVFREQNIYGAPLRLEICQHSCDM